MGGDKRRVFFWLKKIFFPITTNAIEREREVTKEVLNIIGEIKRWNNASVSYLAYADSGMKKW